jgi:hypothetical protein
MTNSFTVTRVFALSVLLMFNVWGLAQDFNGGLMAGLVGSQVAGDTYSGYNKAGLFLGGFVNYQFSNRTVVQMELEYFQKGSRKNPKPDKDDYTSYLFRVNYIELPVLYQYVASERIKVEIGPSAGFLVGYYEEKDEEEISDEPGYNKPAPVTLQLNLGMYFYLLDNWAVSLRTNNSLLNIRTQSREGDVIRLWGYGQFNDCLVLTLNYTFSKVK